MSLFSSVHFIDKLGNVGLWGHGMNLWTIDLPSTEALRRAASLAGGAPQCHTVPYPKKKNRAEREWENRKHNTATTGEYREVLPFHNMVHRELT